VRVSIDRKSGDYETFRRWKIFADDSTELEVPERELRLDDGRDIDPAVDIGGFVEQPMESVAFGRIAAQQAKQVIVQRCAKPSAPRLWMPTAIASHSSSAASSSAWTETHICRSGQQCRGLHPADRHDSARAGQAAGPDQSLPQGSALRAARAATVSDPYGARVPDRAVQLEVPEVGQGLIQILGAARDAGVRAKIAVRSNDPRIDPVGACVGMRGSRVQAVSNEIAGERVDIIPHDENAAQFVINAMSPAEVMSIVVDEDSHSMDIAVSGGKAVAGHCSRRSEHPAASQLTGWDLNVIDRVRRRAEERDRGEGARTEFHETTGCG